MTDAAAEPVPEPVVADELVKAQRVRWRVTGMFVVLVVVVGAGFAYDRWQRAHDCDTAYRVREHSEQKDVRIFTELGVRLGADETEIQAFLDEVVHAEYNALPPPAAC